ncbi:MAG: CbiX/SirB N-terminal domain-containing protein [Alphaproteobacteria bacterium]|nr:CbiX/SirB N-terminal domain-containing protein [Alphaproteobacteria bacterium]
MLVGHGTSRGTPETLAIAAHARAIAGRGLFAGVQAGNLNGQPRLEDAFAACQAETVFVVPVFMSRGYAVRSLIPDRLGADPRLRYTEPVGTHPRIAEIASAQARALAQGQQVEPKQATLMLVGHGTPKDPASAAATRACAAGIRGFADVRTAFIDEPPFVADAAAAIEGDLVAVGFFADAGGHATEDVPNALGLAAGVNAGRRADGRTVLYTGAVGTDPGLIEVILDQVAAADTTTAPR